VVEVVCFARLVQVFILKELRVVSFFGFLERNTARGEDAGEFEFEADKHGRE
jgi:hypothetical protein